MTFFLECVIGFAAVTAIFWIAEQLLAQPEQSWKSKKVDELIERGDRLREQWDATENDLAALVIEDQMHGVADDLCYLEGYAPDSWCGKRFRDVIFQGASYESAVEQVMATRKMDGSVA